MSKQLRVAFIDQVGGSAGGAEETLATFIESARSDLQAHAILFEDGAFAERLRSLGTVVDVLSVSNDIMGSTRERMRLTGAMRVPAVAIQTASLLRKRHIDLAYTNSMKAHFVGAFAARAAGVPCVMHFHDLISGTGLNALRAVARFGSRERIACSQMVASTIGVGDTTVIYGPVKLSEYEALPARAAARTRLGLPQHVPIVSLVGRINRWKGHDAFLRIAARVAAGSDAHFAIAGAPIFRDADFVPELHALAEALHIADRVTFIPWLNDVREIYAASDVNTNCSTREPFGRAVVEAGACGIPTVCYGDSGAAETIINAVNGFTVPPGDEERFATAILQLLGAPEVRRRVSFAARIGTERFDAGVIAEQMSAVIRRSAA